MFENALSGCEGTKQKKEIQMKKKILAVMTMAVALIAGCGDKTAPSASSVTDLGKVELIRTTLGPNEAVHEGWNWLQLRAPQGTVIASLLETDSILSFDGLGKKSYERYNYPARTSPLPIIVPTGSRCIERVERIQLDFLIAGGTTGVPEQEPLIISVQILCEAP